MLYVAYFFPPRYAWPLAALEVGTYASPLITTAGNHHLMVGRSIGYAVGYVGVLGTIQFLKRRLIAAERHQHRMARVDPLTGLANRRAFDEALTYALATGERFTLLLADVDYFKQINDRFGHTTGDRVLRELAAHTSAVVRTGDCLARIGGDELALVAPGAGTDAARRLAETLRDAGTRVDAGDGPLSLTVSYAVLPAGRHGPLHPDARARPRAARAQGRAAQSKPRLKDPRLILGARPLRCALGERSLRA